MTDDIKMEFDSIISQIEDVPSVLKCQGHPEEDAVARVDHGTCIRGACILCMEKVQTVIDKRKHFQALGADVDWIWVEVLKAMNMPCSNCGGDLLQNPFNLRILPLAEEVSS